MAKDGYVIGSLLLGSMIAMAATMVCLAVGNYPAMLALSAIASVAMTLAVTHMMAMVFFNGAILHDFGASRGWWEAM